MSGTTDGEREIGEPLSDVLPQSAPLGPNDGPRGGQEPLPINSADNLALAVSIWADFRKLAEIFDGAKNCVS